MRPGWLAWCLLVRRHQYASFSMGIPGPGFSMRYGGPQVRETESLLGDGGTSIHYTIPDGHLPRACTSCDGSWREAMICLGVG